MANRKPRPRTREIVAEVERFFGDRVLKMAAPGGKGRDSYRVHFADRSIIVTYRGGSPKLQREARVLEKLSPICASMPRFLGSENDFLYQSDVGDVRLSQSIQEVAPGEQVDMASEAVAAILRIQSAARAAPGLGDLPHLGASHDWVLSFVNSADKLARYLRVARPDLDRASLCARLAQPPAQFLKWDCRAGNAALDDAGALSWFDFEYSGFRHGAEDIAWLIGDEVWPVSAPVMFDIVADALDGSEGHSRDSYLEFLALYATFHALQRIMLVLSEVKRRGWSSQTRAIRYDKIGAHPLMGARVADTGAWCAARHAMTRNLVPVFEQMSRVFAAAMPPEAQRLAS